jgi:glycosyltransferase involved in cell wall biosynthesis
VAFGRRYSLTNLVYVPFLVNDERYSPGPAVCREAWQAATGGRFFVLMTSRQDYLFKGSDIAIQGFARFAAQVPEARLVVTGWGSDREKAADLFRELGIAERVHVVPIAGKRRLVDYLRSADCVIDQLSIGYYGASALEAMACGRPVVMKLNREQYDALLPEGCAPVCNAATPEEVAVQLVRLAGEAGFAAAAGDRLRQWFLRTHDNRKWGRVMDAILMASGQGRLPDFRGSPLDGQWDNAEAAYLAAELAAAPPFPQYF